MSTGELVFRFGLLISSIGFVIAVFGMNKYKTTLALFIDPQLADKESRFTYLKSLFQIRVDISTAPKEIEQNLTKLINQMRLGGKIIFFGTVITIIGGALICVMAH